MEPVLGHRHSSDHEADQKSKGTEATTLQMRDRGKRDKGPVAVTLQIDPTRYSDVDVRLSVERPHWNISGDVGLVSAGRINKDTPPLTTPGRTSRSSAMDISSHIFQIEIHEGPDIRFRLPGDPRPV
jgi:hypothetical protein